MCLIIKVPAGKTVDPAILQSALECNPDGFGYMAKGRAKKFLKANLEQVTDILDSHADADIAIHFRMATDGRNCRKLAHPFRLKSRAYLMHNGILTKYRTDRKSKVSDTWRFVREFCDPLISRYGSVPRAKLEKEIVGSKVAVMLPDGNITLYGGDWIDVDGCKFSNTYAWEDPNAVHVPTNRNWYYSPRDHAPYIDGDVFEPWHFEYDHDLDTEEYGSAHDAFELLLEVVDDLPLNTPDYIDFTDMELYDGLLSGECDAIEFLEYCSTETINMLFNAAVAQRLL